jgi:flavin-dependent dehydrogenase
VFVHVIYAEGAMGMLYDVAVVGAGPAGSACAVYLARQGWRVALVDRGQFPRHKPCAECLSPAAEPLLARLGVLHALAITRPARLKGFRLYAPNGDFFQGDFAATRRADGASYYETALSIPRYQLDHALVQAAQAAGAELHEGWRCANIERDQLCAKLIPATDEEPLRARLAIAADGLHSTIAQRLGVQRAGRLRKIALVAHLRGMRGVTEYTEVHVAGRRYVGINPLEGAGDLCNVAMVVDEARDGRALAGRAEAFLLETLPTFPKVRERLMSITVERHTLSVSRLSQRVGRLSSERLMLAGDATGYYDPFTGEGIYRALRGAELVAQVAHAALSADDLSVPRLATYDRLYRAEFRGKRLIERAIQQAVQLPPLANHIARVMRRHKHLADTMIAVTGDFLPPGRVLRPGYLARLLF